MRMSVRFDDLGSEWLPMLLSYLEFTQQLPKYRIVHLVEPWHFRLRKYL
jgi:hypothetical protein